MALYLAFGALAGQGLVIFDQDAGTVTFQIEHLTVAMTGLAGYVVTFVSGRFAKTNGGHT